MAMAVFSQSICIVQYIISAIESILTVESFQGNTGSRGAMSDWRHGDEGIAINKTLLAPDSRRSACV